MIYVCCYSSISSLVSLSLPTSPFFNPSTPSSLCRTTPTLTLPWRAWWRISCLWRRREPWVTPQPLAPKPNWKVTFWFCLASTTMRRRRDSVGVQDVPRLNLMTEASNEGGWDGWIWTKRLEGDREEGGDDVVEWLICCNLTILPLLSPFVLTSAFRQRC